MTLLLVSLHLHAYFIQCKNRISLNLSLLFVFAGLAVISGYVSFLGDGGNTIQNSSLYRIFPRVFGGVGRGMHVSSLGEKGGKYST